MILRRLEVRGWKCFAEPTCVGPFQEGLNVVHAPNASGKSTLLGALTHGLFDEHRVGGREVELLRSWGRQLAPTVTIDFGHEQHEYRLVKCFLDRPRSELAREEKGRFVPLSEGDVANKQVREMLLGTSPSRGVTKSVHWGLAQVLWAPQGQLAVAPLSRDLLMSIHESLGAQVAGAGSGDLEARIDDAYLEHFTDKGKLRSGKDGSPVTRLEQELEQLAAQRRTVAQALEQFSQTSREVEDLERSRDHASRRRTQIEQSLEELQRQQVSYQKLVTQRKQQQLESQRAAALHGQLKQRIESLTKARAECQQARAHLDSISTEASAWQPQLTELRRQMVAAETALEAIRQQRTPIEAAFDEHETARGFIDAAQKSRHQERLLADVRQLRETLDQLLDERAKLAAPDAQTIQQIRRAARACDEARHNLDAALVRIEIEPLTRLEVEAQVADQPGHSVVAPEESAHWTGAGEVQIELKGIARIRARGPSGSVEQLRERARKSQAEWARLCAPFASTDLEMLEQRHTLAERLATRIAEVSTQLDTLLAKRTPDQIAAELREVQAIVSRVVQQYPAWLDEAPDAPSMLAAAKRNKDAFIRQIDEAERAQKLAANALATVENQATGSQARLGDAQASLNRATAAVSELEISLGNTAERQGELDALALSWSAAEALLKQVDVELAQFADDPTVQLQQCQQQHQRVQDEVRRLNESRIAALARLQQLGHNAPYSELAALDETIAAKTAEMERHRRHIGALSLLRNTLAQCRRETVAAVARPVEEVATRILSRIAGSRPLGRIHLAETFEPQRVAPGGLAESFEQSFDESTVALDRLSGGEQEQVHLAVRLALGEILGRDGRQLVVLDDVLTATDTARLSRILNILEEAAQRLQILVLTCHPERFEGLSQAHFFDLREIARPTVATG